MKKIIEALEKLEQEDLDEVWDNIKSNGAIHEREWQALTPAEKCDFIYHLEVYDWQDFYIGFYTATNMIKSLLDKESL